MIDVVSICCCGETEEEVFGAGVALISSTSGRNVYKVDAMSELVAWTSSTSGRGEVEGEEFSATVAAVSVCCRDRFEWGRWDWILLDRLVVACCCSQIPCA